MTEQTWYGGLAVTGRRAMTDDEHAQLAALQSEARRQYRRSVAWLAAPLVVAVAALADRTLLLASLILTFHVRDRGRKLRPLHHFLRNVGRDLEERVIDVCQAGELTIEVLPATAALWSEDGRRTDDIVFVSRGSTAPLPDQARRAANFVRPAGDGVAVHQRQLSDGELLELDRYVPVIPFARIALAAVAAIGLPIAAYFSAAGDAIAIVVAIVCLLLVVRYVPPLVRDLRERLRMRRDLTLAVALIVRTDDDARTVEILPHSGILWTEHGEPAMWRTVTVGRE